jgi:hypothetical protein
MDCGFRQEVVVHVDVAEAEVDDDIVEEAVAGDTVAGDFADAHCWTDPCFPSYRRRQRIHEPSGRDSYSDGHPRLDESLVAWKDWVVVVVAVVAAVAGVTLVVGLLVQAEAAGDTTAGESVVELVPVSANSDDSAKSSNRQFRTELHFAVAAAAGLESSLVWLLRHTDSLVELSRHTDLRRQRVSEGEYLVFRVVAVAVMLVGHLVAADWYRVYEDASFVWSLPPPLLLQIRSLDRSNRIECIPETLQKMHPRPPVPTAAAIGWYGYSSVLESWYPTLSFVR